MKKHKKNMKTVVRVISMAVVVLIMASMLLMFTGCGNQALFDTTWTFERGIIFLPDGEKIEGNIQSWKDFDGSDMVQVTIDGKTYLTHSSNVIMIAE